MRNIDAKVRQAKESGYTDVQIVDYLSSKGMGEQMQEARSSGHSYEDIVRHLSGEKRGVGERFKQGMAGAFLATGQMGSYIAEKSGLGDIVYDEQGLRRISPEEAGERRKKFEGGIKELDIQKGDPGIGASLAIAAGDPSMWAGGLYGGGLIKQGLQAGALYESMQPQSGEFDPLKKAQDVAVTSAVSGAVAPVMGKAFELGAKYSPTSMVSKGVQNVYGKVTGKTTPSVAARASSRVKDLVADPLEAAAKMEGQTLSGISAARQSGEPGLIGLEDAVRKSSPEMEKLFSQREIASRGVLADEARSIGGGVSPSKTTEFIEGRRDALVGKLNEGVRQAERRAQEKIGKLAPEMRESEAAIIVRDELENALKSARAQESILWQSIPNAGLTTAGIKRSYKELIKNTPKAQLDDIPAIANDLLGKQGKFKNIENVGELQGLRSKLLEESRTARATGNYNKARIADDLADAVLNDLGAQAGAARGKTGEALRKALDYSRTVNETYRQGNVGRVLGTTRQGGERIAPEMTLGSTIGAGGTRGGVAADELLKASPSLGSGMRDYVLQRFNKVAVKDGRVNPQAAQKFMRENADILDKFPDIRQSIDEAVSATGTLSSKQARAERVTNALFAKQKSATAEYLGASVDKEFARIIGSKSPGNLARELRKMAAKDQSGDAVKGLKTGAVEYLMSKAAAGADDAGNVVISGNKLKSLMKDNRTGAALLNTLSPDEYRHLARIADEFAALERSGASVGNIIDSPMPNKIMTMAARVAGAKIGTKVGGGGNAGVSLQAAQMGSSNAKEYLKNFVSDKAEDLLIQSVQDKTLRDLLLADISTTAKQVEVAKKLSRWAEMNKGFLAVPPVDQFLDEAREPQRLDVEINPSSGNPMPQVDLPQLDMQPMNYVAPQSSLFQRVIQQESGGRQFDKSGNPLRSPKGATGIAQVMPKTAPEAAQLAGLPWDEQRYLNDPEYNAALGEAYLNRQLQYFGDETLALMAYNWGPGNVTAWVRAGANPSKVPAETRNYVKSILRKSL